MMCPPALTCAIESVPTGAWAVGVSGGADSVALLALLRDRTDLQLQTVHLDHQLRGQESTGDADFVEALCRRWSIHCTIARLGDLETDIQGLPTNPSARFRAIRLHLYRRVIEAKKLQGVILAHHADDQAETILQRLLRGAGVFGVAGMNPVSTVSGITILRPLLPVTRQTLRDYLIAIGQTWREDSSNSSPKYQRNQVRQLLGTHPDWVNPLLELGQNLAEVRQWTMSHAPVLPKQFACKQLADLPLILAEASARHWLEASGCPVEDHSPVVVIRLIEMARDAASPSRWDFPGSVRVIRRAGRIQAVTSPLPDLQFPHGPGV